MRGAAARIFCLLAALAIAPLGAGCGLVPRSGRALLRKARTAPDPEQRRRALLELRGRLQPQMREDLEAVLANELDPATRAVAADHLGELGDPAAATELRRSVRADSYWVVRKRALGALAEVLGSEVRVDLEYALENEPNARVRARAVVLAPQYLPEREAVEMLTRALEDSTPVVRLRAANRLAALTGMSAPPQAESWREMLRTDDGR